MLMKEKHITGKMVCDTTHIPESTYDKFMAGKILRPDWINVIEIIRYLGGSVDILCGLSHDAEMRRLRRKIATIENQLEMAKSSSRRLCGIIADDTSLNIDIAKFMLEERGISYSIATNGEEAVKLFAESEEGMFDFILMDVVMPVMSGLEATSKIRKADRWDHDLPIICTTVKSIDEAGFDFDSSGFSYYLYKPINADKLDDVLESVRRYAHKKNAI